MKKSSLIILYLILFNDFTSSGQTNNNPLFGTWEIIKRDYVYQKNSVAYTFNKEEALAYTGQKIVFNHDSLLACTTFFSEMLTTPIKYDRRKHLIKDLNEEGNLKDLLSKKGESFDIFTITEQKRLSENRFFEEYNIYYFLDGSIGILSDFSLFYLKRVNFLSTGFWDKNEFGQAIINGNYSESLSIPVDTKKKYFLISYLPNKKGENFLHIEADSGTLASNWSTLYKIKDDTNHNYYTGIFKVNQSWKKIRIFIGGSTVPLIDDWQIRYKFINEAKKVKSFQSIVYTSPNTPTKMYLLKGDEVEIIEEKNEWLKIRYYGKKTIEGWIKRSDVE